MNRNVIEMVIFQRSLTKDAEQDKWVEMIWWESMEAAKTALEEIPQMEIFKKYCSTLKEEGTMMFHLEKIA